MMITAERKTHRISARVLGMVLGWALMWSLAGCSTLGVLPSPNEEKVALAPVDVVTILGAVGLTDEEIINNGLEFRNALAGYGSAKVERKGHVIGLAAVRGGLVHISTLERGSFVFDPREHVLH